MEIKAIEKKPMFKAKLGKRGDSAGITVPKDIEEDFKLERGKTYRFQIIEDCGTWFFNTYKLPASSRGMMA